jgi:DSF synthase
MSSSFRYDARSPEDFPFWRFSTVDVSYDAATQSVWMYYKEDAPPYYSMQTLIDMASVRESLRALFASSVIDDYPIRHFVMASRKPGVFKLGGDLAMFADSIRSQQRDFLRTYAHACIDVVYGLATAFDLPIVTLAVISGQALGGGLEAALALDYMMADSGARLGVPEVAFNTFPGMGAVTLLSRRLGTAGAEEIITSGRVYTGHEMYDLGVVDLLAPEGGADAAAVAWMSMGEDKHVRRREMAALRRKIFPVSRDELMKITELWVDCSAAVSPHDIRHMERLAAAQQRRFA